MFYRRIVLFIRYKLTQLITVKRLNQHIFCSSYKPLLFVIIVSFFPLLPILLSQNIPHTSDGAMHMVRIVSYYNEFINGQVPVRWTSQFHFGHGTALFNFTAPLPYIIGSIFIALNLTIEQILKISLASTFIFSGIGMYMFAYETFKNEKTALFVSIMYQFAPFRLVDMLIRGNIGSLYSYMLIPYALYFIEKYFRNKSFRAYMGLIIVITLLCLSHTIISYIFIGVCFLYITLNINKHSIRVKIYLMIALFHGIILSAFFILPAILEHKYTNAFIFTKNLFYDHFPPLIKLFTPNFFNQKIFRIAEVPVQIGFFHVISFFGICILFLFKKVNKDIRNKSLFVFVISILCLFFMNPLSTRIWENLSILRQFQFPWRLISVLTLVLSYGAGLVLTSFSLLKNKITFWIVIILIIGSTIYYWVPEMGYIKYSKAYFWNYPYTTNYHSEVNSIWMGKEPDRYPVNKSKVISGKAKIDIYEYNSTKHKFTIHAYEPSQIVDNTYFFPGWKVYVNGVKTDIQFQDPNYQGLITYNIPKGKSDILVQFEQSKIQQIGNIISLFSATLFTIFFIYKIRQ